MALPALQKDFGYHLIYVRRWLASVQNPFSHHVRAKPQIGTGFVKRNLTVRTGEHPPPRDGCVRQPAVQRLRVVGLAPAGGLKAQPLAELDGVGKHAH
jgi:hypothetical protein